MMMKIMTKNSEQYSHQGVMMQAMVAGEGTEEGRKKKKKYHQK